MIARLLSSHAHLDLARTPTCERRVTPATTTLCTLLLAFVVACGGGTSSGGGDTYARGTQVQESCCEQLKGAGRDACLKQIVRIDDRTVAGSQVNQSTFACVVDHFSCDAATGHATRPSAQDQLECIQDLQVSTR